MISAFFAGCFGEEETEPSIVIETVWDFERPDLTWYHMPDAVDAWEMMNLISAEGTCHT